MCQRSQVGTRGKNIGAQATRAGRNIRLAGTSVYDRNTGRHGMALVAVLGALVVVTMLLGAWARTVVRAHRQQGQMERRLQADWLVEAGLDRAVARLTRTDSYTGETWNIAAGELGGADGAVVTIHVEAAAGRSGQRVIAVRADYPDDPVHRVRRRAWLGNVSRPSFTTVCHPIGKVVFSRALSWAAPLCCQD